MKDRNSLGYTLMVAAVLCVVCSLAVSYAAVALRPLQDANQKLDQQLNILDATGLAVGEYGLLAKELDKAQVKELNGWVSAKLVDLATGDYVDDAKIDDYDMIEATGNTATSEPIVDPEFNLGEPRRPKVMKVFFVKRPGSDRIQQVVLPIYGKGLWGTLYGYLAIKSDLETAQGLTFYQHKETPGLGGEVDNAKWKASWEGVKLYDPNGAPAALVFKGPVPAGNAYAVDGLSGATITGRGVTTLIRYWTSDEGYGPFLKKLAEEINADASSKDEGDK